MWKKMVSCFTLPLLLFFSNSLGNSAPPSARKGLEAPTRTLGAAQSLIVPPRSGSAQDVPTFVPGPDIIAGDLSSLQQFGSSGTQVGLALGSDSCNNGNVELNFFAMPNTDHPIMAQNLYRMSVGATNDDRFEQIGQSWLTHGFFALQNNACSFGCTPASGGNHLGVGCSNADSGSINAGPINLGSRAWVNPFTGLFPSTANSHTGHTHNGTSHRVLVNASDLDTTMNPGATYYAEAQFVTPHEYAWCQAHPGECNLGNNASYRRFNVAGTTSFIFSAVGATVRTTPAINAWTGATMNTIEPDPGVDGRAFIACKVTNPSAGIWHYEYAINNQNLDRAIQSLSLPLGCGVTVSSLGFHAPPNHPGFPNDGTLGNAGFSNAPWTSNQTSDALSWNSETFTQNQNANALRFGTLYNFRFDSNRPPQAANATIGFFKTGTPITVGIQGPSPDACTGTPTPAPTTTPTPTVSISGNISYCSNPVPGPVPNVTLDLTGDATVSTVTDGSGNYMFSLLAAGGSYEVTPTKGALAPGSTGIDTVDVIATQRHFLKIAVLPVGCRRDAADVNGDTEIDTVDVTAIRRFFLGLSAGIANTGKYKFTPVNRTYLGLVGNQTGQNYDTLVFGDVASTFVERLDGPSKTTAGDDMIAPVPTALLRLTSSISLERYRVLSSVYLR